MSGSDSFEKVKLEQKEKKEEKKKKKDNNYSENTLRTKFDLTSTYTSNNGYQEDFFSPA